MRLPLGPPVLPALPDGDLRRARVFGIAAWVFLGVAALEHWSGMQILVALSCAVIALAHVAMSVWPDHRRRVDRAFMVVIFVGLPLGLSELVNREGGLVAVAIGVPLTVAGLLVDRVPRTARVAVVVLGAAYLVVVLAVMADRWDLISSVLRH